MSGQSNISFYKLLDEVEREACKESFYDFVQSFWDVIIKEVPVFNWHIQFLCDELQQLSKSIVAREKKPYDLIINIPPGTTKSTIATIMWPAWLWTQDATIRIITNSYSMDLSIEHSTKSRDILVSDKYKRLFPHVRLRRDKGQKTSYENTMGGARYTTSTAGTITGKHAHCLAGNTIIDTVCGPKPIENICLEDRVLSYFNGIVQYNKVLALSTSFTNELYEFEIGGHTVRATGNHQFFILGKGYTAAKDLRVGDQCITFKEQQNVSAVRHAKKRARATLSGLLPDASKRGCNGQVPFLRQADYPKSARNKKKHQKRNQKLFLLTGLLRQQSSFTEKVRTLRGERVQPAQQVLQKMQLLASFEVHCQAMSDVPEILPSNIEQAAVLFETLREQSPLVTNGWGWQFASQVQQQLSGVVPTIEASDYRARQNDLRRLRKTGQKAPCASHKRKPGRQFRREPDHRLSELPYNVTQTEELCTINSIVRKSCEKQPVYDIQVEGANNFFANKILVHNCIISDDPLNPGQAASDAERKAANEHTKTLASRKVDKANTPMVTIMQRLHEEDVTGYLLKKKSDQIRHLNLPAEVSNKVNPPEIKEKYINGLLDPVRLNRDILEEAKTDLGSMGYSGQFDQDPMAKGGNIVKSNWFKYLPFAAFQSIRTAKHPIVFFMDTAYTEKDEENDPTGIIATCKIDNLLYITKASKVYKEFPELVKFIPEWIRANGYGPASMVRIEPKASGLSVLQYLKRNTDINITNTPTPKDDKQTRLTAASPRIESERVVLITDTWNEAFVEEICGFPNKKHDEYVDLIAYAIDYHLNAPKTNTTQIKNAFR